MFPGTVTTGREQGDLDSGRIGLAQVLDLHVAPSGRHHSPGGARRRKEAQVADREVTALQSGQHLAGDGPRGPDDGGADHHNSPGLVGGWKAAWRRRVASSTCDSAMTHETRMVGVEIITMLIPAAASTENILAATPG